MLYDPSTIRPGSPIGAAHARDVHGAAMAGSLAQAAPGLTPSRRGIVAAPPRQEDAESQWYSRSDYPWGSRWPWGFELRRSGSSWIFRLHNPMMRVGQRLYPNFPGTTLADPRYRQLTVTSYVEGDWGLCLDLEWTSAFTSLGAQYVLVASEADLLTQPEQTELLAPERIPICWWSKTKLVRDYIHGMLYPQVMVSRGALTPDE
jgi:hypothetical protein